MPFGMIGRLGPRNSVLRGVTISEGEGATFGENMCPTNLTPLWIANWTDPCSGVHNMDSRLIASVGRVCYRPRRGWGGIAHRGRSLISMVALLCLFDGCAWWCSSVQKPLSCSVSSAQLYTRVYQLSFDSAFHSYAIVGEIPVVPQLVVAVIDSRTRPWPGVKPCECIDMCYGCWMNSI